MPPRKRRRISDREIAQMLLEAGYEHTEVANRLGVDLHELPALVSIKRPRPATDDEALRSGLRMLSWLAIEELTSILREGIPSAKLGVARALLSPMMSNLAKGETQDAEQQALREDLEKLLSEFRHGTANASTSASDQDQRGGAVSP